MRYPNVGELIEISLGPFEPKDALPQGKVETYSSGAKFVTRLEPITKLGHFYFAHCKNKTHKHIHIQTPSLAKFGLWLVWCQVLYGEKKGIWKTRTSWKENDG